MSQLDIAQYCEGKTIFHSGALISCVFSDLMFPPSLDLAHIMFRTSSFWGQSNLGLVLMGPSLSSGGSSSLLGSQEQP